MFENIKSIREYTSTDTYSFHGDSIEIEGTKVVPPLLEYIIRNILKGDENGINDLMNYQNYPELIDIDVKIDDANKKVDEINNFSFDEKIDAINTLKAFFEDKKAGRYFDVKLLQALYDEALSLFELELKQETIITEKKGKIALKDLKGNK